MDEIYSIGDSAFLYAVLQAVAAVAVSTRSATQVPG